MVDDTGVPKKGKLAPPRCYTLTRQAPIIAANLKKVHRRIESGRARGKIVLEGVGSVNYGLRRLARCSP